MRGSRSTALNPLGWGLALTSGATLTSAYYHEPVWLVAGLGSSAFLFVLAYLIAYFILLFKDRDALRSERYQLSKLAIERSMVGDNITGFVEPAGQLVTLPTPDTQKAEG